LEALGARVEYHDAHVPELAIEGRGHKSVELTDKALGTADLVIITTDHPEVDYGRVAALAPRVLDTRNATAGVTSGSGSNVEKL
jgi:UDP-N-acetyl-D-glucosamine dehydrogenase